MFNPCNFVLYSVVVVNFYLLLHLALLGEAKIVTFSCDLVCWQHLLLLLMTTHWLIRTAEEGGTPSASVKRLKGGAAATSCQRRVILPTPDARSLLWHRLLLLNGSIRGDTAGALGDVESCVVKHGEVSALSLLQGCLLNQLVFVAAGVLAVIGGRCQRF